MLLPKGKSQLDVVDEGYYSRYLHISCFGALDVNGQMEDKNAFD